MLGDNINDVDNKALLQHDDSSIACIREGKVGTFHQESQRDALLQKKNEERSKCAKSTFEHKWYLLLRPHLRSFGFILRRLLLLTTKINIDQTVNSITMHLMAIPILPRLSATLITLLLFSPINGEWIRKNGAAEQVSTWYDNERLIN